MKSNIKSITFNFETVQANKSLAGTIEEQIADRITIAANVVQDLSEFRQETRAIVKEAITKKKLNVERLEKIMTVAGWSKQDISKELTSYGVYRRKVSKAKAAISAKLQTVAQREFETLKKTYSVKDIAAIGRRLQILAQEASK